MHRTGRRWDTKEGEKDAPSSVGPTSTAKPSVGANAAPGANDVAEKSSSFGFAEEKKKEEE